MTPELQRAMAGYEAARIEYKKAVLASLDGTSDGTAIRQAIRAFQDASAELKRHKAAPATLPRTAKKEPAAAPSWGFFLKLLKAG